MEEIRSLKDLSRVKEAAQARREKINRMKKEISVSMGTCGIAAGAHDTLLAFIDTVQVEGIPGITIQQTGCIGLCKLEPVVKISLGGQEPVLYGRVNPAIARRIVLEHVLGGQIVQEFVIEHPAGIAL